MRSLGPVVAVGALVVAGLGAGCGDDGERSMERFCDAVDHLEDNDPFDGLDVASPEEMSTAFDDLSAGADEIADAAPGDLRGPADRYRDSVDALVEQLSAAAFDPRDVDSLAYGSATDDYEDAAVDLERAAGNSCP